jgi:hypothetical protein
MTQRRMLLATRPPSTGRTETTWAAVRCCLCCPSVWLAGSGDADGPPAFTRLNRGGFAPTPRGIEGRMELSLLLIVIGIVLAVLVNYALGILCIVIGLVLLILPRLRSRRV